MVWSEQWAGVSSALECAAGWNCSLEWSEEAEEEEGEE